MILSRVKISFGILLFALGILYTPVISFAALDIGVSNDDINVTTIPENPGSYEDVTITLSSYSTDLNKAQIEWRSGSTLLLSGYGKINYALKTLGPNTPTTLVVKILPSEGGDTITKTITLNPSEVEILWESVDGYVPPFYKGKSFTSSGGVLRVVAFPATAKSNITYTWKSGDNTILGASGYNKSSYIFTNSELKSNESVTVLASSVDSQYTAMKTISIPIISPQIIFYKKSPVEGVLYNTALANDTFMSEDEMTIVAEPYFFSFDVNANDLSYTWKINGQNIATPSKKTELTVHPTSRNGYATIELVIENLNTLFQKVIGNLTINI